MLRVGHRDHWLPVVKVQPCLSDCREGAECPPAQGRHLGSLHICGSPMINIICPYPYNPSTRSMYAQTREGERLCQPDTNKIEPARI